MATTSNTLGQGLSRAREVTITVTGRKSGRQVSIPVWFVLDGQKLYLVPVQGSQTQWYKNVLNNPQIRIAAGNAKAEVHAVPVTDSNQVAAVVEQFRKKYGAGDVKKYYSKFDAAIAADIL
jgi:deazaflavin-dependent oxidoreductase (nitroreductase family)